MFCCDRRVCWRESGFFVSFEFRGLKYIDKLRWEISLGWVVFIDENRLEFKIYSFVRCDIGFNSFRGEFLSSVGCCNGEEYVGLVGIVGVVSCYGWKCEYKCECRVEFEDENSDDGFFSVIGGDFVRFDWFIVKEFRVEFSEE